ncbi:unnamed protein product [Clonostachys chloroleuca]|uniref:Xylanolytic transcriptional activator regulatory domain-containing protein n=1 Tax=Clonostachys chloroleuca TaxID=1926264 RepID=A0AA35M8K2_9HYPO|nr:unnamed protein product [Clonostachys chloroleuca]
MPRGNACSYPETCDPAISARLEWLSKFIGTLLPESVSLDTVQTGADLSTVIKSRAIATIGHGEEPQTHAWTTSESEFGTQTTIDLDSFSPGYSSLATVSRPKLPAIPDLPIGITHLYIIKTYFSHFHLTYPFLDKDEILASLDTSEDLLAQDFMELTRTSIKLYLVMALGCELLRRAHQLSSGFLSKLQVPYPEVVQLCLETSSIESAQILMLLSMYSIHNLGGWPRWLITSLLGRQAIALGLNQKQGAGADLSRSELESRNRLFWSIYSIDRLVSVSYGLPLAINDNDVNIPLPAVTTEEFAAPDRDIRLKTLQIARHTIALRALEGRVLSHIHSTSTKCPNQQVDRRDAHRAIQRFHDEIEDWYAQGCLNNQMHDLGVLYHSTISWLNANYHRLLCLLYCSSSLNSELDTSATLHLYQLARKQVLSLQTERWDGQMALNHLTFCRIIVIVRILLHCYAKCGEDIKTTELREAVLLLKDLTSTLAPELEGAENFQIVLQEFTRILDGCCMNSHAAITGVTYQTPPSLQTANLERVIIISKKLTREALGASSVYNHIFLDTKF